MGMFGAGFWWFETGIVAVVGSIDEWITVKKKIGNRKTVG